MFFAGLLAPWVLVSKVSTNLIFDGMLYDVLIIVSGITALVYFTGDYNKFNVGQWVGIGLFVAGIIVFKICSN